MGALDTIPKLAIYSSDNERSLTTWKPLSTGCEAARSMELAGVKAGQPRIRLTASRIGT